MGLNILFHIVILIGGSEYIKEIKTNPRFYTYGSVFKKPQSFFCLTASKTASKNEGSKKRR